ncbi:MULTISPECIES: hypothetical protein [unclassified Streptomyces]|uniref:hypothetical protein n=1 Tax=unclassified Streptomyces TaxID=2593676 RepID=UPI00344F664E
MTVCEVCGNDYARSFEVRIDGESHSFDCVECAAQRLAPTCENCQCRILGHGLEASGRYFCCAHCARTQGVKELADSIA